MKINVFIIIHQDPKEPICSLLKYPNILKKNVKYSQIARIDSSSSYSNN